MTQPIIAIYFTLPKPTDAPFHKPLYVTAYRELSERLHERGGRCVFVRGVGSYTGGNTFAHGWEFKGETLTEVSGPITADVIFNKQEDDKDTIVWDADARLLNAPTVHQQCRKHNTYARYAEYAPFTTIVPDASALDAAVAKVHTEYVVIKPVDGGSGRGVNVVKKDAIPADIEYPAAVQEFLDTSGGIPEIPGVEGIHDLRFIFIGGVIRMSYVRIPAPGLLTANYALGGHKIFLGNPEHEAPKEALAIAHAIDDTLKAYPTRLYTIDLGRDRVKGWKIFELNSPPGLFPVDDNPLIATYMDHLADHFIEAASHHES